MEILNFGAVSALLCFWSVLQQESDLYNKYLSLQSSKQVKNNYGKENFEYLIIERVFSFYC